MQSGFSSFPKSNSQNPGVFDRASPNWTASSQRQNNAGLFNRSSTPTSGSGLFSKASANYSSGNSSSGLFSKSNAGGYSQQGGQGSQSSSMFNSTGNSSMEQQPFTSSSRSLFTSSTAPSSSSSRNLFNSGGYNSNQQQQANVPMFNQQNINFAQQNYPQEQQQFYMNSDIFDENSEEQPQIEQLLFARTSKQMKENKEHVFPVLRTIMQAVKKRQKEEKSKKSKKSKKKILPLFTLSSEQQKKEEQKKDHFNNNQPQSQAAMSNQNILPAQQNRPFRSLAENQFRVMDFVQDQLVIQVINGRVPLQVAQQQQYRYQLEILNAETIPQHFINLAQINQQKPLDNSDPLSSMTLKQFFSQLNSHWEETKTKYQKMVQQVRKTEQKYFKLKNISDQIEQAAQSITMMNAQLEYKLQQLDIRAIDIFSKVFTLVNQLVASGVINQEQVEIIKRICECDIGQLSDMTLVDFKNDVKDRILKYSSGGSDNNENKENVIERFRGISCLLLGVRHMKDIVRKLRIIMRGVKPLDKNRQKQYLKMIYKGRIIKKFQKGDAAQLRERFLHQKIRGFFQQIVKLEQNTAKLRKQLQECSQAQRRFKEKGSQIKNQFLELKM